MATSHRTPSAEAYGSLSLSRPSRSGFDCLRNIPSSFLRLSPLQPTKPMDIQIQSDRHFHDLLPGLQHEVEQALLRDAVHVRSISISLRRSDADSATDDQNECRVLVSPTRGEPIEVVIQDRSISDAVSFALRRCQRTLALRADIKRLQLDT